jgi:hypothetical protein
MIGNTWRELEAKQSQRMSHAEKHAAQLQDQCITTPHTNIISYQIIITQVIPLYYIAHVYDVNE